MDKLARQLRDDADRIDCTIPDELDRRIRASLEGITPETTGRPPGARRSPWFWWASSLTGVAAVATAVVLINRPVPAPEPVAEVTPKAFVMPRLEWQVRSAVLTMPLEQEMQDLESDLKKAEKVVKQDIDRLF
jgi:hypothetical protein